MSSTSNSQNLLVNVFRPVYTYSAGAGFTPRLVVSNVDILSAGAVQTGNFQFGDSNNNLFIGSNAGGGSNNSANVGIGVGAMQGKSDSAGTVAIGTNALAGAFAAVDSVAVGGEITGGGQSNVILGARSGTVGSNVILLGPGLTTTGDVSGKIYVGSGNVSNALIYGDLNARRVGINTVNPSTNLDVSGDMNVSRWIAAGYGSNKIPNAAVDANGYIYASMGFQAQGGSAQYPAFTFLDDSGTGIYKEGPADNGRFAITSQGTKRMDISGDTLYIYANLRATGSVNIGAVDTSAFSFGDGFVRDNATTPQTDVSRAGIRTTLVDASSLIRTINGSIRVGPAAAPTVDISGSSIRAAQLYGTTFVMSPFFHDSGGTFDLSSGGLRFNNVVRTLGGAFRVGSIANPTIDISGGTVQTNYLNTSGGTVTAPTHSFTVDPSLGLYRAGPSALGFASAGIQRMCISGGNVGIGKGAPVTALEVVGDVSATAYNGPGGTAVAPHYTFSDDRSTGFFFPSASQIGFTAGGAERMRISNGNVGIGTTAPTTALDISGGTIQITSATSGPITLGNGTINVNGTPIVSASGAFSNASTTSNSIGGVTLSNLDICLAGTGRIRGVDSANNSIGGVTLVGGSIQYSGFISGTNANTVNSIGGVTLSNTILAASTIRNATTGFALDMSGGNIAYGGAIAGSTVGASNQIGGVTLSNTILAASTIRNATTGFALDMSGGNIAYGGAITGSTAGASNQIGGITLSNNRIGIGTTAPNSALDISAVDATVRITDRTNGIPSLEFIRGTNPTFGGDSLTDWRIRNSAGNLTFTRNDNTGIAANNGDFVTMTYDGSMGIGTTDPRARLDVSGGIAIRGVASGNTWSRPAIDTGRTVPAYELRGRSSGSGDLDDGLLRLRAGGYTNTNSATYIDLTGFNSTGDTNNNITFGTAGLERMRVLSNGNVGIRRTAPVVALDVNGDISSTNITYTGAITGSTVGTSNRIGGVTLSNNRIGIGTTAPTVALDVNGDISANRINITGAGSGTSATFYFFNQPNLGFYGANNTDVAFVSSNAERLRFNNFGIFNDSTASNTLGGVILTNNLIRTGIGSAAGPTYTFVGDTTTGFFSPGTSQLGFTTAGRQRMVISNSNVGIGLAAPGTALDVSGTIRAVPTPSNNDGFVYLEPRGYGTTPVVGDTTVGQVVFQTPGPFYASMRGTISNAGFSDGLDLRFTTNQAANNNTQVDRMTIRSITGFVGIGTTNPTQRLDVNGTIRGSSNIVAVATADSNQTTATWTGITANTTADLLSLTYTPKQSGSVKVIVEASVEYYTNAGTGIDTTATSLTDGANTELRAQSIRWNGVIVDGRVNNYYGSLRYIDTITTAKTYKIRMTAGDDGSSWRRANLVAMEISTT